jgi:hypothetical protein
VRRLLHILLKAVTIFSLLLCVAMVALWVRSYFVVDTVVRSAFLPAEKIGSTEALRSHGGKLLFDRTHTFDTDRSGARVAGPPAPTTFAYRATPSRDWWDPEVTGFFGSRSAKSDPLAAVRWHGFYFDHRESTSPMLISNGEQFDIPVEGTATVRTWFVSIPLWPLVLALLLSPAVSFRTWHKRRRLARSGSCTRCGYDLRATPDRCPECGMVPAASAGQWTR